MILRDKKVIRKHLITRERYKGTFTHENTIMRSIFFDVL